MSFVFRNIFFIKIIHPYISGFVDVYIHNIVAWVIFFSFQKFCLLLIIIRNVCKYIISIYRMTSEISYHGNKLGRYAFYQLYIFVTSLIKWIISPSCDVPNGVTRENEAEISEFRFYLNFHFHHQIFTDIILISFIYHYSLYLFVFAIRIKWEI